MPAAACFEALPRIATIPATGHFCWIGERLPWAYVFAILSAARRGGLTEVVLHHTDALADGPELQALHAEPLVRLSRIDPHACIAAAGSALGLDSALLGLYRRLASPVARADVLRVAILYLHGGIYLDLDTITTAPLQPLLDAGGFVGQEFIVWPHSLRSSRSPARWLRALALDLLRKAARSSSAGWRLFRRVERHYHRGVNNAVMGAHAKSSFLAEYLRAMTELPVHRQALRYALGPDLLQAVVDRHRGGDLVIHIPEVFYVLPPEVSEHWFRDRREVRLAELLRPGTRIVHWYASVRTGSRVAEIDPDYVQRNRYRQFYSALVCECIGNFPVAAPAG